MWLLSCAGQNSPATMKRKSPDTFKLEPYVGGRSCAHVRFPGTEQFPKAHCSQTQNKTLAPWMFCHAQVRQFYTAPTLVRALEAHDDKFVTDHDRSSLRVLGTVGEPINPRAWNWFFQVPLPSHTLSAAQRSVGACGGRDAHSLF